MTNNKIGKFLSKSDIIAVIGVSEDDLKYGNKVFFNLLNKGYQVFAIHHKGGYVNNLKRYTNLSALPTKPDIVISVVPPEITKNIIIESIRLNIKKIWLQPGSENEENITLCSKNNINFIAGACIILNSL